MGIGSRDQLHFLHISFLLVPIRALTVFHLIGNWDNKYEIDVGPGHMRMCIRYSYSRSLYCLETPSGDPMGQDSLK